MAGIRLHLQNRGDTGTYQFCLLVPLRYLERKLHRKGGYRASQSSLTVFRNREVSDIYPRGDERRLTGPAINQRISTRSELNLHEEGKIHQRFAYMDVWPQN